MAIIQYVGVLSRAVCFALLIIFEEDMPGSFEGEHFEVSIHPK